MLTVYKYALARVTRQTIALPKRARILCAEFQGNELFLWAQVDTNEPHRERYIHIYGTGHDMKDEDLLYINTVHLQDIGMVYHVFENPS